MLLPAHADEPHEPSESGAILVPLILEPTATLPADGLAVSTSFPFDFASATPAQSGPLSLPLGQTAYFYLPYSVALGTPQDVYQLAMELLSENARFEIDDSSRVLSAPVAVVPTRTPLQPDSTPPATTLSIAGPSHPTAQRIFLATHSLLHLSAVDPASEAAETSGVASTRYLLDQAFVSTETTPGTPYVAPFSPPLATDSLAWFSLDTAGNRERVQVASVTVDSSAPLLTIMHPMEGDVFLVGIGSFTASWALSDDNDPRPGASAVLVQVEDRGVARGTSPAEVSVFPNQLVSAAQLDDGLWELRVFAEDFVQNRSSAASGPFEVVHVDPGLAQPEPPSPAPIPFPMVGVSSLTVAWVSTTNAPGALYYAQLSTAPDFSGAVLSSETYAFSATFTGLLPGAEYHARAAVYQPAPSTWSVYGALGSTRTLRDLLPPRTRLTLGQPSFGADPVFISSRTLISLLAVDDLAELEDGLGFGIASLTYAVDGSSTVVYAASAALTLAEEGPRTVTYVAADLFGNIETVKTASFTVDATPPTPAFTLSGSSLTDRMGRVIISTDTRLMLSAFDALSGVGALAYSLDGGPEVLGTSSSTSVVILEEGPHTLSFQALDRVQNRSVAFSTSVIVDVSAPVLGAAAVAPAGGTYQPASVAISTTRADAAVIVSDLASGLDVTGTGSGALPLEVIPGTLGLWHFDEGSGRVTADAANVAGPGTLNDGVDWVEGKIGKAVRVSATGASSHGVTLAAPAYSIINNMSAGTIELWGKLIQAAANSNHHTFTTKQHNGSDTMFYFGWEGNSMSLRWQASNGAGSCIGNYNQAIDKEWHHFAVTWAPSASKLYLDGRLLATCGGVVVPNDPNPTCLSIAGGCGDGATTGIRHIDEVRVLNVALSGLQIEQDATSQGGAFSARVSVDGGQTFSSLGAQALSLTGTDGVTSPQTLTAEGLSLAASTSPTDGRNVVEFSALDMSGRMGTARRTLLVNLNAATEPVLLAPSDGAAASSPTVLFRWRLAPGVPEASVTGYTLQLARDSLFTADVQDVAVATNSVTLAVADGNTYWRVRAHDTFGAQSPFSAGRRVSLDSLPPEFGPPEVAAAGSGSFVPASRPQNTVLIDARATVRDASSGLAVTAAPGGATPLQVITGTLGLWHFDEGSGRVAADAANVAGPGTLNDGVDWVPGKIGKAVRVSSEGQLSWGVTLAPAAYSIINNMAAGTVELWGKLIRGSDNANHHTFTTKQHNGSDTMFYFGWEGNSMSLRWQASNGSGSCIGNYQQAIDQNWHHFAVTWSPSASKLYLDGRLLATCGGVVVPNDPNPTCLSIAGGCGDGATTGIRHIDEVRILNVALSGTQIGQDAASPAPVTPYLAAVSTNGGTTFAAVSSAAVSLTGVDGSTATQTLAASGLALVESASLAAPLNVVRLTASDLTGKTTTLAFTVLVDTTPPTVAVSSPAAGAVYAAGSEALVVHASVADRLDPAPSISARLVQQTDEGGNGLLDELWVSTGAPLDASLLDAGSWIARVEAADFAGNVSTAASGVFRVERDVLPPQTVLVVSGPRLGDAPLFVTPRSSFSLTAFDDLKVKDDRAGVGVAASSYSIGSASGFALYTGSFSIVQEGAHDVRYYSVDLAGHAEEVQVASVAVDGSGPEIALTFLAPYRVLPGTTTVFAQGLGPLALGATDYPDLAVGTTAVYLSVDGGPAAARAGPFSLTEGLRSLAFWGVDALGNQGSTVTAQVKLDATAPAIAADLTVTALSSSAAGVSWTAPGDDGPAGDIFDAAVRLDFGTTPGALSQTMLLSSGALAAGARLERSFSGLAPGTTYYAVAYTRDSAGHWSPASPLASARTYSVAVSADGVAAFTSPVPAEVTVVSTVAEAQAYTVAITSQGLTPSGTVFYELTDGLTFATAAVISFVFDPVLVDSGSVRIYTYDAASGAWTSDSVFNQTLVLLDSGLYRISGEIFHTSLYAPMVRDTAAPRTAFSLSGPSAVFEGNLFAARGSSGVLTAEDLAPKGGVRSGIAGTFYRLGTGAERPYGGPFGLPEGDLAVGFRSVDAGGNAEEDRAARVFVDATAPTLALKVDQSTFAVPGGFGTLSATATLTLEAVDPQVAGARSGLAAVSVFVDGVPLAVSLQAGAPNVSTDVFLSAGLHTVAWAAVDRMGQAVSREVRAAVGDTLPPLTALTVGAPKAALPDGAVLVSASSPLTLAAEDKAESGAPSGVAAVYWRFVPEPFALYGGSFAVPSPAGPRTLEFYAVDRAGNAENPPKTQALVLDDAPPALALSYPRPDEGGLCRLAQGRVAVRGLAADAHLAGWELGDAGVLLGSGTADADGVLGFWDAAGKTGSYELRLSAADLVDNAASASLLVQAGQPTRVLALGGKQVLNKPRGVAAGPGRVYVADTNADRVRVFDAAGVALTALGDKKGAAKLNKPAGLALDAAGNILVADANNKRVVKLSPAGVFLAEYGKGLLKRPMAVALSLGRVAVADAKAGQLVVFSEAGALLARVDLPPAPAGQDEDPEEPRPVALAADAAGNVWAADAKGGRVLRFTPGLALAQTIVGFERPEGVAVSPSGACLAVSDAKAARIRTFDAGLSAGMAAFGVHGEVKENKPLPTEFFLNKPAQLAFTAEGALLVADRNNDLIQGFGLPGTPVVAALSAPGRSGGGSRLATAGGGEDAVVASARVGRLEGGRVEHPDGAAVEIPAGAVGDDVDVAVTAAADAGDEHRVREAGRNLAGLAAASAAREFSPHGLTFSEPARITLPYDPLLAAAPRSLKIHYWNPERSAWEALESEVDEGARTVSARVAHFSVYQVLAPAGAFSTLADPDAGFAFRASYAFPNPAVGGQKPTVHVAVGRADKVTVRFYDVAGTPVHEATLDTPSVVNDESGPHWAYEYAWNGHIPSGVYLYSVTAEKAGHAPIKRIGKLAVVR